MKVKCFFQIGTVSVAMLLLGCGQNGERRVPGTVTVSGTGTVYVAPDMVYLAVSMDKTESTTRLAQEAVGKMTEQVVAILKDSGVEDKDIMTTSLRFYPEYEWYKNRRVLVGQHAEQSVNFAVRNMGKESEKVARIIDRLTGIDGITIDRLNFSVEDNMQYFIRSRELAFGKAMQKARQYAELSGCKVGKVLSLSEFAGDDNARPVANAMYNQAWKEESSADRAEAGETLLPAGQMEIKTQITVEFLLE